MKSSHGDLSPSGSMRCPFCAISEIENGIWHETEYFYCLYNHKPILPGHSLVIPRKHCESFVDMDKEEMEDLVHVLKFSVQTLMKAYNCTGYNISLQNGEEAGASINHIHWHVIPRKENDIEGDPSKWHAMIIESERHKQPISNEELQKNVDIIKKTILKMKGRD